MMLSARLTLVTLDPLNFASALLFEGYEQLTFS